MRLLNLATVVTVLAIAIAAPALAGKGGNGNGGGNGATGGESGGGSTTQSSTPASKPSSYSPSLYVSWPFGAAPTTSSTSTPFVVAGCGYNPSYGGVTVVVYSPYAASFAGQMPDGGCISLSNFSTQGPGAYKVEAWQHVKNRDVVVASTTFTVS